MNVYWIDSYKEYDPALVESVMGLFMNYYGPLLKEFKLNFQVVDITELQVEQNRIIYKQSDLLVEDAIAYINCTNPSLETEKLQKDLYDLAIKSKKLSVLNYFSQYPLVDKNKLIAINLALELGIKTIETINLENPKANKKIIHEIEDKFIYPVVIKPVDMFGGIAVQIVNNTEQLSALLEILTFCNRKFIAQKKLSIVSDCRVYIADFEFLSCLKRTPKNSAGLGNIAKGATTSVFTPPPNVIADSIKIARKINATFLCVDWFEMHNEGFIFSEIETAGGFVQLPEKDRKKVAQKLFRWRPNE
ncbi:MAG: ATP-grasp domain-containing protein [Pseudobdellovibrionaceae bacterium]